MSLLEKLRDLELPKRSVLKLFPSDRSPTSVKQARERYGIELLGKWGGGFFGVPVGAEGPIVALDEDRASPPTVLTKSLVDFLCMEAFAPGANWAALTHARCDPELWSSMKLWGMYQRDAEIATDKKVVAAVTKALCTLPGVKVPKEPWRLREGLPVFKGTADVATKGGKDQLDREVKDEIRRIFREHFEGMTLLFIDELTVTGKSVEVLVGVDAPEDRGTRLAKHEVVQVPFKAFKDRVASASGSRATSVKLFVEQLTEDDFEVRLKRVLTRIGRPDVKL